MEKRHIPQFDKTVSLLGFGAMRFPLAGTETQAIDYPTAEAMLDKAIAAGVNYFDTAYMYHGGASEVFLGCALAKYPRESFYLADKFPLSVLKKTEDVDRIFVEQLERCRVSYFDFYLAHALSREYYPRYTAAGVYDNLRRKKEEGLIRHLGFSFHDTPEFLERMLDEHEWDFVQIQLNYIDWESCEANRLYAILTERKLPAVIMEPVRGGALATLNEKAAGILKAADPGVSIASWAIRYAATLPNVMCVLSGMSTMEQVEDNLKTMTPFRPLNEAEYAVINEAALAFRESGSIPCTACRYCMPCPAGVNIPRVLSVYNHYCLARSWIQFKNHYKALREDEVAEHCIACNACVEHCPQKIDIPGKMEMIKEFVAKQGQV